MARTPLKPAIRAAAARLLETPARFPLALVCAALGTLSMVTQIHKFSNEDVAERLLVVFVLGFFASLAAKSFAECRGWPSWRAVALGLAGIAVIAAEVFPGTARLHSNSSVFLFLGPAVVLLATMAPFLGRGSDDDFWAFNRTAWLSGIFAGAGALVLFLGVAAALNATQYMFRIDISHRVTGDAAAVSFVFFAPWLMLSGIPRDYHAADAAGLKWIERLATYILVPLAVLYLIILYVYIARIVVLWELPRGRVAYIVAGCALFGAVVHLITHGFRDTGARPVRLFHRLFYPVLLAPTVVMTIGVLTRIGEYGMTESRYAIVLLALWLAAMSALHLAPVKRRLVWVPASLAALAFIASFGPWGAQGVALGSQLARLETLLARHSIIADMAEQRPAGKRVDGKDAKDISSIVRYLQGTGRMGALESWFAAGKIPFDAEKPAQNIVEALGVRYYNRWNTVGGKRLYINNPAMRDIRVGRNSRKAVLDVGRFRDLALINFHTNKGADTQTYRSDGKRRLRIKFDSDSGRLTISDLRQRKTVSLELIPLAMKWKKRREAKKNMHLLGREMTIDLSQGAMRLRLHFINVTARIADGKIRISHLQFLILIGEAG